MWRDYSVSYIKKNKAVSISIMMAAFIAALFISMLCSLFYNMWIDDTTRLMDKEGVWQARFSMELSASEMQAIENYSNVSNVVVLDDKTEIYFKDISSIYDDMPQIAKIINAEEDHIEYHSKLLARKFVFSPEEAPPLLWIFYACILILVCVSLILIMKSAFQFSMNRRVYQLGILASVGATPKQLRIVLLYEALMLSVIPILIGTISGMGLCIAFMRYANKISGKMQISGADFEYHYLLFVVTMICSFLTIFLSAWFPARRLSKISPLQAIKGEYEKPIKTMKMFRLTSAVFGIEGELSRKSLYTRRKAFRTATICLTISFLVVTVFLNFMTISEISTSRTFFEKYKNSWDIMIEIENSNLIHYEPLDQLKKIEGVETCTIYQKDKWYTAIHESDMSDEVSALGGYNALNDMNILLQEGTYLIETPILVLDNESYLEYGSSLEMRDIGGDIPAIILVNTIWDSQNSDFKNAKYIQFLKQNMEQELEMYSDIQAVNKLEKVIVSAYAEKAPDLREEYGDYSLIQVMSQDTYHRLLQKPMTTEEKTYINIGALYDNDIERIEKQCKTILGADYEYVIENRPEQEKGNAEIYAGYRKIITALCGLLACIGVANVFANTLGYIHQRKREFARYQSIGLTPSGISKMLFVEAVVIGVKPIIISIPFNIAFIIFATNASGVSMSEFIPKMPVVPVVVFSFAILFAVAISYMIGGKQVKSKNIIDSLKDDTLL